MVPVEADILDILGPQDQDPDLVALRSESRPPPALHPVVAGASCVFSAASGYCCGCDCDLSWAIYCAAQYSAHLAVDMHHLVAPAPPRPPELAPGVQRPARPAPAGPWGDAVGRRRARRLDRALGQGYVVSSSPSERSAGRRWGNIHARTMPSSYLFGRARTPTRCGPGKTILRSLDRPPSRCSGRTKPVSTAPTIRRLKPPALAAWQHRAAPAPAS